MIRPKTAARACACLVLLWGSICAAKPPQPTGMNVFHHSGQSFITWAERTSLAGEQYRVYRHTRPIRSANLAQAEVLRQVARGSGRFFADRYNADGSGIWRPRYFDRFVIRNVQGPLPADTGLLVWTLADADFGGAGSGSAYYAVTTVDRNGVENREDFSAANTAGPVQESVADPAPVEIKRGAGGRGHVYTQYMDLRNWNPTFHAPNASNGYYGLDPADPAVARSLQYAYTYTVGEPDPANCPSPMPARLPVLLNLHGWADNTYPPDPGASQYYCAFEVRPIDVSQTWWFGFARTHDYRENGTVEAGDTIVNFTENRVMRMIYDLERDPAFNDRIDSNRIYVYGQSMGGSGTLALALRYPKVFAAAYASEPMTRYGTSTLWREDAALKWGRPSLNLPVSIQGPGKWASGLTRFNGIGVWDWQNHQANVRQRQGDEFVPFGVAHGRNDHTIEWSTQGRPAYAAFNASRHAWGGAVTDDDHVWLSYIGLPPSFAPDDSLTPFFGLRVVRNETVPGLTNASGDFPLPPPNPPGPTGGYNQTVEWSASWNPWDGAPVDQTGLWGIGLRTTDRSTRTVDVTPRRMQQFKAVPGRSYRWENRRISGNALVAGGTVTADARGLLTVRDFEVTPQGNRLRITSARSWPDTTRGVHVFNDQLSQGMSDAQVRFSATHYAGAQKMIRSEADRLRAVNPGFLILHYRLGHGLGYRAAQNGCRPTGDWLRIVEGNDWVQEWPGDENVEEHWCYHWPQSGRVRVLNCDWGWYLMELNDADYRTYWLGEVTRQIAANDDDGVFLDSLSVPNTLGSDHYEPHLPEVNASFENAWAGRITDWLVWLKANLPADTYVVPNVGAWLTSREATDYNPADGLMIEGFALEADASPYAYGDWQLQMNRFAGAVKRGQAVLAQTYVNGARERMFALGSYLLGKGNRTYLNIELGEEPEWWPEYDIPIGAAVQSVEEAIDELDPDRDRIYRRNFDNGFVLVNPTNPWDGSAVTRTVRLGGTYYLAEPRGGGAVPRSGVPTGTVGYRAVNSVTLRPYSAAVLLATNPASAADPAL